MSILSSTTSRKAPPKGGATFPARKIVARQVAPTHPGVVVARALDHLGGSLRSHAEAMGLSHWGLNKIVSQKSAMQPESALRIAAYLGTGDTGAEHLLGMQVDYDLWHARKALGSELSAIIPAQRPKRPR